MKNASEEGLLHRIDRSEPVLAYSHSSVKTAIVMGIVVVICVTAGILVLPIAPAVSLPATLISIALFYHIMKSCSVRIWVDWPNLVYRYRALFRSVDDTIPSWEITGLSPEITWMWRGSISERLVIEAGRKKYIVTPFYNERDPGLDRLRETLGSLPSTRKQALYEIELERRVIEGDSGDEEEAETVTVWAMLEMNIQCPRCDGPVVVNGPYVSLTCPGCSEEIEMTPDIWADLLEDLRDELADDTEEGKGGRSTIWGTYNTSLYYGRLRPYCSGCKRDFDMENGYDGGREVVCPGCGEATTVMPAPEWFDNVFEGATLIVGARETQSGDRLADSQQPPVNFTCSQCGASIQTRGEDRTVECGHCGGATYLQDDLWSRFHPVPVKQRWFVGFEAEAPEAEE